MSELRLAGLTAAFLVFSVKRVTPISFPALTIAFTLVTVFIVAVWARAARPIGPARLRHRAAALLVVAAAGGLLAWALSRWVELILWNPIDPLRGDMLVVVREGIRRFVSGRDPYALYHLPWEAPLPYGPALWGPFVLPYLLHVDLRTVTVAGELIVPVWCAMAAAVEAARGRFLAAAVWLILIAAVVLNPDLATYTPSGHTPSYWFLLPLFALLVAREQWTAAATVMGLLIVARTTMIAVVPVLAIAIWTTRRSELARAAAVTAAVVVAVMLPFIVWNAGTLWYGMVASYPRVMKEVVWLPGGGVYRTIGLTGWLLTHGWPRAVEPVQVLVLLLVYGLAARALRRGAPPLPWMALALFAFSATTLWPVYYLYFDVLLLFAAGAAAETIASAASGFDKRLWLGTVAATGCGVAVTLVALARAYPTIAFPAPAAERALYRGFEMARLGGTDAAPWIWGLDGILALPRGARTASEVAITAEPVIAPGAAPQVVTVWLNGTPLGTVAVERGWHTFRLRAPRALWIAGANELKLVCAASNLPATVGLGPEPRHFALGVRRVEVTSE